MIVIDFETRSAAPIKEVGASVYAQDKSTEVLCLAYSLPIGEIQLWTRGDPPPQDLLEYVTSDQPHLIHAHNATFERLIWHHICHKRMGWPDVPFDRWRCSAAECSRLGLPRSLDKAIKALGLPIEKDMAGNNLMLKMCKPRKPTKHNKARWHEEPADLQRLYQYCIRDVEAEQALCQAIEPLPQGELKVWQLDQRINARGVGVDLQAVERAQRVVEDQQRRHEERLQQITGGMVTGPCNVAKLLEAIRNRGIALPDLREATVQEAIQRDDLPGEVREMLEIRLYGARTSVAKLKQMSRRCEVDHRVRENLVYHGAATGRWAGQGLQIQNFPRGSLGASDIERLHLLLCRDDPRRAIDLVLGEPLECISGALRSMIRADRGKRLIGADFAQIEARTLAWLAREGDLIQLFRDGQDVYKELASRIYEVDVREVTKTQRFVGKTAILGLGYGMGHRTFRQTCKMLAGVTLDLKFARQVVKTYRETNPRIKSLWQELNTAAIRAIETGHPHQVGRLLFYVAGDVLQVKLPSRRELHYHNPILVEVPAPWTEGHVGAVMGGEHDREQLEEMGVELGEWDSGWWVDCDFPKKIAKKVRDAGYKVDVTEKDLQYIPQIQYWGVNSMTRTWSPIRTYGGKLAENVTQAVSRDFLAEAMLRAEAAGYPIIATIHDEILCEREQGEGSLEDLERIMKQVPDWGAGCPIDVEGFEAERYRK